MADIAKFREAPLRTIQQWKAHLLINPIDEGIECGRWGSCQYFSATNFFDKYFEIRKDLNVNDTLAVLGCTVSWTRITNLLYVKANLISPYIMDGVHEFRDMLKDHFFRPANAVQIWFSRKKEGGWKASVPKTVQPVRDPLLTRIRQAWFFEYDVPFIKRICDAKDLDEIFEALKESSWDLWSAASRVTDLLFKDFKICAPQAEGYGPILNRLAQSENFQTGLQCALLYDLGLVKKEKSFAGFDT